jgi:membrane associated rhomboid family serine protease
MGIYDRDYYRKDGPSILAVLTEHGKVCKWLILINVVLFVGQLVTRSTDLITGALDLNTADVLRGQVWRLLTYAFLHDPNDLFHILFNMLFLWWFGADVEDLYGPREFLAVYLTAAVLGGLAFVCGNLLGFPQGATRCIGASGAVMAVLVLCALHYPSRVIYLFFFLPIPIWVFVLFMVAKDAYTLLTGASTGTAVTVHLGGAAFAYIYHKRHWRLLSLLPSLKRSRFRRRPSLRIYRDEPLAEDEPALPVASSIATRDSVDEHLEAKLDAVLEKVARHGKESLSENERQILMRASEVYRRKRT